MSWILAIWKSISSIADLVKILYEFWKKTLMKTEQDKIDDAKKKTDDEQEQFKQGKGGKDVEI